MPVNAACLKHARGNGRPYCVLKHAVECKHSTWSGENGAYQPTQDGLIPPFLILKSTKNGLKTEHYRSSVSFPCLPAFLLLAVESPLLLVLLDNGLALESHADAVRSVTLVYHDVEEVNDVSIPTSPSTDNIGGAEILRSRVFDEIVLFRVVRYLAIELNINCNRKIAEVIFKTLLNDLFRKTAPYSH